MKAKRGLFCAIVIILSFFEAHTQPSYSYGVNPYYGAVLRYKGGMEKLKFSNLHGVELFVHKQTDGSREWETKYNYPILGAALAYYNYGIPEELGNAYSASGYIDFTFSRKPANHLRMNLGTGIVFSDVIYDGETNPGNKAIGSHISYIMRGTIYYHYKFSNHWAMNFNAAFRHYSNGRTNMPNNGMNFPIVGVGIEYQPQTNTIRKEPEELTYNSNVRYNIFAGTAWREVLQEDEKHKAYSVSAYLSKRTSWYNALTVGLDGFYYSKSSLRKNLPADNKTEDIDGRLLAIAVGNELYFGKLALIVQSGFYLYDKHEIWSGLYQRYGLKYNFNKYTFVQTSLKCHLRTANMIEWGMGVSL